MKNNTLLEVHIDVTEEAKDALIDFLLALSPEGIVEGWEWEGEKGGILAYFEKSELKKKLPLIERYLDSLKEIWGEAYLSKFEIRDSEPGWEVRYQEYFRTKKVTDHIVVTPPWENYRKKPDEIVINILPGVAFGTGTHETTRLCLMLMEEIFSRHNILKALDIGTGSGILAIAAALLGANEVVGIEIDPDAAEAARENVSRNSYDKAVTILTGEFNEPVGLFDLVLSNLTARDIFTLAENIARSVATDGFLVISGLLVKEGVKTSGIFIERGFSMIETRTMGEWSACSLIKIKP